MTAHAPEAPLVMDERPADALVEENRRLRHTMRDLVALSTLPAIWSGLGNDGIASSLCDVLMRSFRSTSSSCGGQRTAERRPSK